MAGYVDHLAGGAAMDIKSLAKSPPGSTGPTPGSPSPRPAVPRWRAWPPPGSRAAWTRSTSYGPTAGLPGAVGSPAGLVTRRLLGEIPPEAARAPAPDGPGVPAPRRLVECAECGAPGRPDALPHGLCGSCWTASPASRAADAPVASAERDVAACVGTPRDLLRLP
ncbi:hypothetical protein [Streptomyces sp. NPDC053728]|uniref:hypothetical protein n=1 Tax=Streptomyces sp. NPDC053728 TaxID=3155534 RepID=UPI00342A6C5B